MRLGTAIVEVLLPIFDDIKTAVSSLEDSVSNLEGTVSDLANRQDDINARLDSLDAKQDELNMKVTSVSSELEQNVSSEVKKTYNLLDEHVYSNTFTCGGKRGWRHVVSLDMTDPNTNCPPGWQVKS